ncbi:MAG TPA: hypothetical protein VKU92_05640 [Acidimicrobiales bacterium]|nr:hypothetical protein [Acidimicrobiales bacterium]
MRSLRFDGLAVAATGLGAALVATGVCLPWISYYGGLLSLSAVGSTNGTWLLVGAGLATLLAVSIAIRPGWAQRWASALLGSAIVLFTLHLIALVHADLSGADAMIVPRQGPGLYVVLAGGLAMCTTLVLPRGARTPRTHKERTLESTVSAVRTRLATLTWQRGLQLALAAIWLVDAVLQAQPYMFSHSFAASTLAGSATGSPVLIATAVGDLARIVAAHPLLWNELFAGTQLLIGVLIARRSSVRLGLGLSALWGLGVWALGESFGSVLTAGATPVTGAPGPALLYVVASLLLWPVPATGLAKRAWWQGERSRRAVGVALTSLLAVESWPSPARASSIVSMLRGMSASQPSPIAHFDRYAAALFAHHGELLLGVATAVLFACSLAVLRGGRVTRPALVALLGLAGALLLLQDFGGVASGTATDVGTGPILALVALCLWPVRPVQDSPAPLPEPSLAAEVSRA